ncbi:ketoacyl-synt-domain-containing protein [Violaceomyces palustris]|uniref:Ketoacyl-synt-domain-containing protein n=1 Tax=Violaceomyces palustris TaxID=1673888 RepID=A0ACD0NWI5_9BASI|nr:ketoacyl-synt-domain-containing protein [Violaceomyces palustris]
MRPEGCNRVTIVSLGSNELLVKEISRKLREQHADSDQVDLFLDLRQGSLKKPSEDIVRLSAVTGNPSEQVAIIGMACRLPGADSLEEFWELLERGDDMCRKVPERLYRVEDYHSTSYRDRNVMRASTVNCLEKPGYFDRHLFGLSIDECRNMDPQQRITLMTVYEALEIAGYGPTQSCSSLKPGEVGTHIAYCSDDYREHLSNDIQPGFVHNSHRAFLAAKINEFFGITGPAMTYDTACSSALVAIEAACNNLLRGRSRTVITGGVNILTQPQITIGLDRGFFLSSTGQCLTFDDAGSGYSRADGVCMFVMKRLPDALADGDNLFGLISSAATNHSGESFSITHPDGDTQKRLYRSGMLASGLSPDDIGYIECHGTGTQAGDFEEVSGIVEAFGKGRSGAPLILGSAKANVGHSESTSGATSLVKALMMLKKDKIPKHIGIRGKLNTKLPDLNGLLIPTSGEAFHKKDVPRAILVDNFSAAGGNTSLVVQDPPEITHANSAVEMFETDREQRQQLLHISAATSFSLDALRRRLYAFLEQHPTTPIDQFCYVLSARRMTLPHRLIAQVRTLHDLKTALSSKESTVVPKRQEPPKIGFAFSGQGAQYVDMGRELYEASPTFRSAINHCSWLGRTYKFDELLDVIRPEEGQEKLRDISRLSPVQFQLGLIAIEVGLATLLESWGVEPSCVAGHSLGEYAALWKAGVLSLKDLIGLVGGRSELMVELCAPNASSMLAVRDTRETVHKLIASSGLQGLEIACINSPYDTVVAGPVKQVEAMKALCEAAEPMVKSMVIPVPYAFHSAAVDPIRERYAELASNFRLSRSKIPVAANVPGKLIAAGSDHFDHGYLVTHLRQPVKFSQSIDDLEKNMHIDHWIELGPHSTTIPLLKGCYQSTESQPTYTASLRKGSSAWEAVLGMVSSLAEKGVRLDWQKVHDDLGTSVHGHKLASRLPTYPFDLDEYWIDFKDRGLRDHLVEKRKGMRNFSQDKESKTSSKSEPAHAKPRHSMLSRCVSLKPDQRSASFEALVGRSPFKEMIEGHLILGVALTPATVFVELALEAAAYLHELKVGGNEGGTVLEVQNLTMFSSLFLSGSQSQIVRVNVQGHPDEPGGGFCQFFSGDLLGKSQHHHGSCKALVTARSSIDEEWAKLRRLIQSVSGIIRDTAPNSFRTDLVYKQFETIVLYKGGFRGMQQVWLSEEGNEGVSKVRFSPEAARGIFVCSPMLLDSMGGLTGFISNVGIASGTFVYMVEAIGRIVITPALSKIEPGDETDINVYTRMEEKGDLSSGSVYFFSNELEFLGCMEGVAFKKVRRSVLERLVGMASKMAAQEFGKLKLALDKDGSSNRLEEPGRIVAEHSSTKHRGGDSRPTLPSTQATSPTSSNNAFSSLSYSSDPAQSSSEPVHLAGPERIEHSKPVLWLFPDGTGLATVYRDLPKECPVSVLGFDSPYLGKLKSWTRGLPELVQRFYEMLRLAQPEGPYYLGGWSIGGVVAMEVGRHLLQAGEEVRCLGLIDSPLPFHIKPFPPGLLDSLLSQFSSNTVKDHFRSCALSLPGHRLSPFEISDKLPMKLVCINAADQSKLPGIMGSESDWRRFFTGGDGGGQGGTLNMEFAEVQGDHWTCVPDALDVLTSIIAAGASS